MNLEVNKDLDDELIFPQDAAILLPKASALMAEFNTDGTLLAIGCKFSNVLIMDFLTK